MRAFVLLLAAGVMFGCSGEQTATPAEKEQLKDNLNKPVDVDKIRANYNKDNPAATGPQPAKDGM